MSIPEFIVDLRSVVGHSLLLLPGVRAVVRDGAGGVLMIRRSDFDRWDLPSGIIEPGEQPAQTVVREVFEETGMVVRPVAIIGVYAGDRVTYPNGDVAQYVTIVFECDVVGGTLAADGEEALEARLPFRGEATRLGAPGRCRTIRHLRVGRRVADRARGRVTSAPQRPFTALTVARGGTLGHRALELQEAACVTP